MKHFQEDNYDSIKEYEFNTMSHLKDDYDYDSMKEYEFNTMSHLKDDYDYSNDDSGCIKHFQD